jgi:hypothetical protein
MMNHNRPTLTRTWAPLDSKRLLQVANQGEIDFPERHPANPDRDRLTQRLTHRGGRASPRTDFL